VISRGNRLEQALVKSFQVGTRDSEPSRFFELLQIHHSAELLFQFAWHRAEAGGEGVRNQSLRVLGKQLLNERRFNHGP
jgi:hypothetical protein